MNDASNDGIDSTEGILADLANLQESKEAENRPKDRDVSTIMEQLDTIAEAAQSLRAPETTDEPEKSAPESGRQGPRSARSAVANRGLVFEQFVRDTSDNDSESPAEPETADNDDDDAEETQSKAPANFDPRNPFAAIPAAEPAVPQAPVVPANGGLIFQVPQAELAEAPEESVDDSYDDYGDEDDNPEANVDEDDSDDGSDSAVDSRGDDHESGSRKRRRGGRGRRSRGRGESDDDSDSGSNSSKDSDSESGKDRAKDSDQKSQRAESSSRSTDRSNDDSQDSDDSDDDPNSRRRRRRRSRSRSTDSDEVTSLKGSTRLEAKRQRRKEGREAGRRRPVITESEFLARRESVERMMLVRETGNQVQLVVVEDGITVEHYLKENRQQSSLIGNVYLGKVQNVLPSMEAAFVDIGKGRNAVLYAGEVNWDALGMDGKARRIETALSPGDSVLVQVTKDPVGHKGARLTSQISLPGRFLVYVPGNSMTGISRKLPDVERSRLKKLLKELLGESAGVIVRTAAEGATDKELRLDVERLAKRWESIEKKSTSTKVLAPQLLYSEPDMIVRIIRDVFNEDFNSLVVDGDGAWNTIHEYVESVAPDLLDRVHAYSGDVDIFEHYRVEEQIQKALTRTVNLPSGGSLVIDRTEAMTVVDVNTGKFTGSGGNLEETVTRNNLEAAEEVVRQLRLRDIGGIIVIDFIDMVLESNRDLVLRRMIECLGRDRTKHQVAEVTSLGLVQMTRKRIGTGLAESMVTAGHDLSGRGLLLPGSEEDGSRANFGNSNNNSNDNGNKRDRKRRSDNKKKSDTETHSEPVVNEASRSAVAAIAKATLKKDEKAESDSESTRDSHSESASDAVPSTSANEGSNEESSTSSEGANTRTRSRRNGRGSSRSRKTETHSDESAAVGTADNSSTTEVVEDSASTKAPQKAPATPEPAAELPLMIGADTTTKVAASQPAKPKRRRKAEPKAVPEKAEETLPTSFVIIGED